MSARCALLVVVGFAVAIALSVSLRGSWHAPGNAGPGAQLPAAAARVVETAAVAQGTAAAAVLAPAQDVTPIRAADVSDVRPVALGRAVRERRDLGLAAPQESSTCHNSDPNVCRTAAEECAKKLLDPRVCRHIFEARDPRWAPDAETRIGEVVAEMELLQLRTSVFGTELGTAPGLDCRATFCDIWLDVDQDALIDRLRSKGQYKQAWQGPRLFVDITYSSGWALDRAEELRLALVVAGLLDQDSRVLVTPVMEEIPDRHSSLWLRVYRCPKTPDVCMPTGL